MPINEDIFGGGNAIELIVRWHETAIQEFDNKNPKSYEWLKNQVSNREYKCYFLKVKDEEQKFLIVDASDEYDIDIYVEWLPLTFSYKIKVNKSKKTKLNADKIKSNEIQQWLNDGFAIEETCKLFFIDINEAKLPSQSQVNLFDRVKQLEILPKTKIENDREIWEKWIEAQDLLLKRNAQPFKIRRYHPPIEQRNDSGAIARYKFKVDLFVEESNDYKEVEEELLNEFHINESFDDEGNIQLKFDDIYRGLDAVIHKKFKDKIEREKGIAAILKLKPLSPKERIENYFHHAGYQIFCFELSHNRFLITQNGVPKNSLIAYLESLNYSLHGFKAEYKVINNGVDITTNEAINKKHKLLFGKNGLGHMLPKPENNVFTLEKNINADEDPEFDLYLFGRTLTRIYGEGNVLMRKSFMFQRNSREKHQKVTTSDFTEDFWNDIKRDLYALDFKVEANTTKGTLSYDFETKEECVNKLNKLKAINKFEFLISPDHPEFKFKVRTNLLKNKTEKQIFLERISDLANVEFQISIGEEGDRKKYLPIGKLNAHESDLSSLVFSIPFRRKEEQKAANKLLEFLDEKKPVITQVEPNLRGDQAKIGWLLTAMRKIANPTDKPNGKAVNEKLGQFIFDSSKAEEVFKDITPNSEEWNRVKKNELLTLNDSQRKAILSALHARDLCLLQGPPGTGKTTVIAELIWQLISQNQEQKVLLTSETNLAVDNAIEKLLNKEHTLVKPLRFGKDTKFEEEGKKYSFNRILKWIDEKYVPVDYEEDSLEEKDEEEEIAPDNPYNNAVQIWMNRIAEKSHKEINPKYAAALKDWAIELTQPEKEIKQYFKDKYFKFANVVGSTCSSSGSGDFSKSYQFIFNTRPRFIEEPTDRRNWIPVEFDAVIMDEASKATPPEMLLPLCFAKKSIVIGDHKQLPPMLNEKEFKEAFSELKDERAKKLSEEIDREFVETSQFERLIMNPKVPKSIAARLNIQYRMHPKINNVIKQFYTGETDEGLEPAQELIDNADKDDLQNVFSRHHGFLNEGFIKHDTHTIWINVDEPEEQSGTSRVNEKEVEVVKRVLQYLKNSQGFEEYFNHWEKIKNEDKRLQEQEIGIISFYGHQVKKLQDVKRYAQKDLQIPIRLKTVDKFQGMERNIIIVSTVRSSKIIKGGLEEKNSDIGFAKAPERLNVALSRARRILIVVGNLKFFESYKDKSGNAIYKNAIDIIRKEGLVIEDYKKLNKYK